jgi:hypothetical protein
MVGSRDASSRAGAAITCGPLLCINRKSIPTTVFIRTWMTTVVSVRRFVSPGGGGKFRPVFSLDPAWRYVSGSQAVRCTHHASRWNLSGIHEAKFVKFSKFGRIPGEKAETATIVR